MSDDDVISDWPGHRPAYRPRKPKPKKKGGMGWGGFVWILVLIALFAVGVYGIRKEMTGSSEVVLAPEPTSPQPQPERPIAIPAAAILSPVPQTIPVPATRPTEQPRSFSADQLVLAFDADRAQADATIKGHLLNVTGSVAAIDKGVFGGSIIMLAAESERVHGIRCFVADEHVTTSIHVGDKISLVGQCEGLVTGSIHLADARPATRSDTVDTTHAN